MERVREKLSSWELEEKVIEIGTKSKEFKFILLDMRMEHIGDLEQVKWGAYVKLISLSYNYIVNFLSWRQNEINLS